MRAFEFLYEFAPASEPAANPTPTEAAQDKKDIMTLIGLKPSREALDKVKSLLADDEAEQEPVEPQLIQQPVEPQPEQEPVDQQTQKVESFELDEDIMESLMEKIKTLNPNDPKDALKISQIEAILEEDVIAPAVDSIIQPKFKSHQENIILDLKGALIAAPNPVKEKIGFLDKCKEGILDLKSTFSSNKSGNIYQQADDRVLDNIKNKISSIEYGTGASKLGKMEVLLTLVGKGVTKQGSGDLTLPGGTEVEIKASSTVKKEGKISTSGAVLYALAKDENNEPLYGSNIEAGKIWKAKMAKVIPEVPISINGKSIVQLINPYIKGNKKKTDYTVNVIKEIYQFIFRKASPKMINALDKIGTDDGIDARALVSIARMIEFEYYKKAIGHTAVLFINTSTGNYRYVDKASDLAKGLSVGATDSEFYTTGILDLQGTYANGISKIFTK